MAMPTARDLEIFRMLVFAVRVTAEELLLRAWWPPTEAGRKNGRRRLREWCAAGVLARHLIVARFVPRVKLLAECSPDGPAPDFRALSHESRSAWWRAPIRPIAVYTATRRTRAALGGHVRHAVHALPQVSHDLGVATMFMEVCRSDPSLASTWRSEDEQVLPTGFEVAQPDAVLTDELGRPRKALEFAADYSSERFQRLHETLVDQNIPYSIFAAQS